VATDRARLRVLASLTVALLLAAGAAADFRQSFRKGVEAIDLQNWTAAARYMQEAIAEQPREGERVRIVAVRFESYLPYYYLGLALYHTGDCAGAVRAWETSEAQGAVKRATDEYAILNGLVDDCRRKLAAVSPTAAPKPPTPPVPFPIEELRQAQAELDRATEAEAAVADLRRDPGLAAVWLERPGLGSRTDEAKGKLATARSWVEAAKDQHEAGQLTRAATLATEALRGLQSVREDVEARRDELRQARAPANPTAAPEPARVVPTASVARPPGAPAPAAQAARPGALGPGAGRPAPPPELRAAADAFLRADYGRTVQILANADFPEPRATAVALLLRGAARYSLYLAGGRRDDALRQASEGDVRACRRIAPALGPDAAFFSPAYGEFFRQAR